VAGGTFVGDGLADGSAGVVTAGAQDPRGDEFDRLAGCFESLGLSSGAAREAAAGRGGVQPAGDGFDAMVSVFERLGLTASEAKTAAIGRGGSELDARRLLRETASVAAPGTDEGIRRDTQQKLDELRQGLREIQESFRRLDAAGVVPPHRPLNGR
jgi:hypothetical protein